MYFVWRCMHSLYGAMLGTALYCGVGKSRLFCEYLVVILCVWPYVWAQVDGENSTGNGVLDDVRHVREGHTDVHALSGVVGGSQGACTYTRANTHTCTRTRDCVCVAEHVTTQTHEMEHTKHFTWTHRTESRPTTPHTTLHHSRRHHSTTTHNSVVPSHATPRGILQHTPPRRHTHDASRKLPARTTAGRCHHRPRHTHTQRRHGWWWSR